MNAAARVRLAASRPVRATMRRAPAPTPVAPWKPIAMHTLLDKSLARLEDALAAPAMTRDVLSPVIVTLPPLQAAYEQLLSESLTLLADGYRDECVHQLQLQRDRMVPSLDRIRPVIEAVSDRDDELLRMVVEYLYTRARLVDELKMFPDFSLEVLRTVAEDAQIEKVVYYLEYAMIGNAGIYPRIMAAYGELTD